MFFVNVLFYSMLSDNQLSHFTNMYSSLKEFIAEQNDLKQTCRIIKEMAAKRATLTSDEKRLIAKNEDAMFDCKKCMEKLVNGGDIFIPANDERFKDCKWVKREDCNVTLNIKTITRVYPDGREVSGEPTFDEAMGCDCPQCDNIGITMCLHSFFNVGIEKKYFVSGFNMPMDGGSSAGTFRKAIVQVPAYCITLA